MRKLNRFPFLLLVAGILTIAFAGCSVQARKARAIERANRYFAAGQYDAAEIDYLNALRLDRNNPLKPGVA